MICGIELFRSFYWSRERLSPPFKKNEHNYVFFKEDTDGENAIEETKLKS